MFDFLFVVVVVVFLLFLSKTLYLSQKFAIPFTLLIYLVYLTYCKMCDQLKGYKDTDLASLTVTIPKFKHGVVRQRGKITRTGF